MFEDTGNDRWLEVSSHDLRRSWATHHLVERDAPVRVMMEIGGWSSYEAIEPYLTKPTPNTIGREMSDAVVLVQIPEYRLCTLVVKEYVSLVFTVGKDRRLHSR